MFSESTRRAASELLRRASERRQSPGAPAIDDYSAESRALLKGLESGARSHSPGDKSDRGSINAAADDDEIDALKDKLRQARHGQHEHDIALQLKVTSRA